jgi:large subunit ribosomal protein L4e
MATANVLDISGAQKGSVELPQVFSTEVRADLIRRAVIAEATLRLQPQSHSPLAGMNTTARYYGAMNSYRTGRHMGIAIRPRQKLGGGQQGQVRRIPSSVKGKRAHPHMIEKRLVESINNKEYQKAIASSIAATARDDVVKPKHTFDGRLPIIISNEIESLKRTKDVIKLINALKLSEDLARSDKARIRKGKRRSSVQRKHRKSVLIVVNEDSGIVKAARNIAGVDACTVKGITAAILAPGGVPGRITIWSSAAVGTIQAELKKLSVIR